VNRVIVPVNNQDGLNSRLAEHFGRAPYFTVVDFDEHGDVANVKTVANMGEHAGGSGQAHDYILELKPNAIIVNGMGPRGIETFKQSGIEVLKANSALVNDVIVAYKEGSLKNLTAGCEHAHHH
jgi:predicted Fe-Mo cluster-binding NifX family protein